MVCIAGVLGNKQVALGPLAVESGIFAFLLLVVCLREGLAYLGMTGSIEALFPVLRPEMWAQ
jgi:hypothetical protein